MFDKPAQFTLIAMIVMGITLETGCVRRRLEIRSNPPGAMAYVNNKPVGRTPIATSFVHYGTMDFRLVKDGYETVTARKKIKAPWYQWPGVDFFSEVIWPQEITDHKVVTFEMRPERIVPADELMARAESTRRQAQAQGTFQVSNGMDSSGVTVTPDPSVPGPILPTPGTPIYDVESSLGSIGAPSSHFTNPGVVSPSTIQSPATGSSIPYPTINEPNNSTYGTPFTPYQ